jgi:aspartyl-tRNA(Asn)/glutamyl-tRNA(Gln) amidotransferase subunit B
MIETVRGELPELPDEKRNRFVEDYGLTTYDAAILTETLEMANYYEETVRCSIAPPKLVANWIIGELSAVMNKQAIDIADCPLQPLRLAGLLKRIADSTISGKIAKQVFEAMWSQGQTADEIIESRGLKQITDTHAIELMVDQVIKNSPQQLEQYRSGKQKVFGYFVGQVMKLSKGKANPKQVNELLTNKLKG